MGLLKPWEDTDHASYRHSFRGFCRHGRRGARGLVAARCCSDHPHHVELGVANHLLTKDVLAVWGQQVEKATNGRVKLQMLPKHPSAAPGTFDAVRDDLVDVSYVTASYTPARHVLPLLAELPGGGATSVINSVAYSRIHWKYLQQVGEYKGVKLLGVFTHGPGQMFNTKRPINKVEDLAGMKIRTGGGIAEEMARALGASAFVKPAPESYELLSSGVADGTFFPLESIISFKLGSVIKYATLFPGGFYCSSFGFFMNEDKWNKLSKKDQDAIASVSGEPLALLAGKAWDATDAAALEEMKRVGIQISTRFARAGQGRTGASQGDRRQVGQGRHRQRHRRRQGACGVP